MEKKLLAGNHNDNENIQKTTWTNNKICFHFFDIHFMTIVRIFLMIAGSPLTGLEIATDTVANATNIFSLVTKNSSLVTKVATRFLYDWDLN